jgi:hypothetical protein
MADLALTNFNLKELIIGAIGSSEGLLAEIAKYSTIPEGLAVGTLTGNYMTDFDVTTATKGSTSVVADAGNTTATTYTTVQTYLPVEFYDYEISSISDRMFDNIIRKATSAVLKSAEGTLADAFVAATITTNTATLVSPNDNCADLSDAIPKLNGLVGQVSGYNGGKLPDWIALGVDAFGRVCGASNLTYGNISWVNKTPLFMGIPLFPIVPTTSSGMNGDGDPCGWVGCFDAVGFGWQAVTPGTALRRRDNGLYALDISITYTYGLHEVAKLMGELINATS